MNTTINTKELKNIIKTAKTNMEKEQRKILSNFVLFHTDNATTDILFFAYETLIFKATGYENHDNDKNDYIISLNDLNNAVKTLSEKTVDIFTDNDYLYVSDNIITSNIKLLDNVNITDIDSNNLNTSIVLNAKYFTDKINTVFDFCCDDCNKFAMNGVLFDLSENTDNFSIVATDGRRLAINKVKTAPEDISSLKTALNSNKITLHYCTIETLLKCCKASEIKLYVYNNKQVIFNCNNYFIYSRMIFNDFPDYNRVIPLNNNNHVTFKPEVSIFAPFTKSRIKCNKITCCFYNNHFFMKQYLLNDTEIKQDYILLDNDNLKEDFIFSINSQFIIDTIKYAKNAVTISYKESMHPFIFEIDTDPDFLAVVMGMNTTESEKQDIMDAVYPLSHVETVA